MGVSPSSWSLFGLIWASEEALARIMETYDVANLRVLEVGCGVGLASMVLSHREADITATDHHPEAENQLSWNVGLNEGAPIPFFRAGWSDEGDTPEGQFDLIIAADVLYEPNHPEMLATFITDHARADAQVIVIDPHRGNLSAFNREMQKFGFELKDMPEASPSLKSLGFKGQVRRFVRSATGNP